MGVSSFQPSLFPFGLGCFFVQTVLDTCLRCNFTPDCSVQKKKQLLSFWFQAEFSLPLLDLQTQVGARPVADSYGGPGVHGCSALVQLPAVMYFLTMERMLKITSYVKCMLIPLSSQSFHMKYVMLTRLPFIK